MNAAQTFTPEDIAALSAEVKIGLLATVDPVGRPHVSLITSLRAKSPTEMTFGQFTQGRSKTHVQANPKVGFLVLTLDKRLWRGQALWTHLAREGEDYELYNRQPMFRYNAYLGINTVHYLDPVAIRGPEKLPVIAIGTAAILTRLARLGAGARVGVDERVLKPWAEGLFNDLGALKFLAYIRSDGYPVIFPAIQTQAADSRTLIFSALAQGRDLAQVPVEGPVAVFGLTMKMESVLVRGSFSGLDRRRLLKTGRVSIDWIYNSMPPQQGQIYPMPDLKPVVDF